MMLQRSSRTLDVIVCMVLYCLVFVIVHHYLLIDSFDNEKQIQPGLLLFIVPGVVAGIINKHEPVTVALLAALLVTPLCLIGSSVEIGTSLWQQITCNISALFWCGSGALVIKLRRRIHSKHHSGSDKK